jgi:hypothetical protein
VTFDDKKTPERESQEDPMSEKDPMSETNDKKAKLESQEDPMSEKDPMSEPNDKKAKLDFDGDCVIEDADFALFYCDENREIFGEPVTMKKDGGLICLTDILDTPTEVVDENSEKRSSLLIDCAKKFTNEDKTPLKSSTVFNAATLICSVSHCLAGILNTPPTTKRAPGGSQSQDKVFGEDTSSDSDDEDK